MSDKPLYHKILPMGEFATFSERPPIDLIKTTQIHSKELAVYRGRSLDEKKADGIFFKCATLRTKKTAVAVTTADCMPILFVGNEKGVFLHAGWRGLAEGILKNPLIKEADPRYCLIGPSISVEAFEVQEDFRRHFDQEEFFQEIDGKLHFDLQGKAAQEISRGFPGIQLEMAGECALKDKKYHSFRRNKTAERNWNIFSL